MLIRYSREITPTIGPTALTSKEQERVRQIKKEIKDLQHQLTVLFGGPSPETKPVDWHKG